MCTVLLNFPFVQVTFGVFGAFVSTSNPRCVPSDSRVPVVRQRWPAWPRPSRRAPPADRCPARDYRTSDRWWVPFSIAIPKIVKLNWVIFRLKTIWRTIPYSRTSRAMDVGPRPQTTIMPIQLTFPEVPLQCDPSKQLALLEQTVKLYSSENIFILFS